MIDRTLRDNRSDRRRLINKTVIEHEMARGNAVLTGHPFRAVVDISGTCGLRCLFCPTGQRRRKSRVPFMSFARFKKIVDRLGPYLISMELFNWGEPLLNKDVCRMIGYAHRKGIACSLGSNLNALACSPESLVASGLDQLIVSLDGTDQQSYERYRAGGDFQRAIDNLAAVIAAKKALKSRTPEIEWQFLVFRHNEKLIPLARRMSKSLGVDRISFRPAWIYFQGSRYTDWIPRQRRYSRYTVSSIGSGSLAISCSGPGSRCHFPWDTVVIDPDGDVYPCCGDLSRTDSPGNLFKEPFREIWNNRQYQAYRRAICGDANETPCARCGETVKKKIVHTFNEYDS